MSIFKQISISPFDLEIGYERVFWCQEHQYSNEKLKRPWETYILVHFVLRCSKIELERTKVSRVFPKISLMKYDNKNLSLWLTKVNLLNIYIIRII